MHDFYVTICSKIAVVMKFGEASGLAAHEANCCQQYMSRRLFCVISDDHMTWQKKKRESLGLPQ
jgi:hypothetical protein